ncbi:MAG: formimidoylglutamase, partial [bacterium]
SLQIFNSEFIANYYTHRNSELKWGDLAKTISSNNWETELINSDVEYVILGIAEDIGIRANFGRAGAKETFINSLSSLLNIQHNRFINSEKILILGQITFDDEYKSINISIDDLRILCEKVDEIVFDIALKIFKAKKKLIVVGGGHNNSYPLLKALSTYHQTSINCLNVDAHTDYRALEGRHSGNGFSYAKKDNYLNRYGILGLHENYNSESVLKTIDDNIDIQYFTFEDIEIRKRISLEESVNSFVNFLIEKPCALEVDLDAIQYLPSSAMSSTGFSTNQMREIIHHSASLLKCEYLHLTEASIGLTTNENDKYILGKTIAYLLSDYIKATQVV